jgi:hypothetical protein
VPEADTTFRSNPGRLAQSSIGKPRVTFDLPDVPKSEEPDFLVFDSREEEAPFAEPVDFSKRCRIPRGYLASQSQNWDEEKSIERESKFSERVSIGESNLSERVSMGEFLQLESDLRDSGDDETQLFPRRRR